MGERDWYARYQYNRQYADEQADMYRRGEIIENWAYETDYKPGMNPPPKKITLTGAAWVAHAYDIAASDAMSLVHVKGAGWQPLVDECQRLATSYREKAS